MKCHRKIYRNRIHFGEQRRFPKYWGLDQEHGQPDGLGRPECSACSCEAQKYRENVTEFSTYVVLRWCCAGEQEEWRGRKGGVEGQNRRSGGAEQKEKRGRTGGVEGQ